MVLQYLKFLASATTLRSPLVIAKTPGLSGYYTELPVGPLRLLDTIPPSFLGLQYKGVAQLLYIHILMIRGPAISLYWR